MLTYDLSRVRLVSDILERGYCVSRGMSVQKEFIGNSLFVILYSVFILTYVERLRETMTTFTATQKEELGYLQENDVLELGGILFRLLFPLNLHAFQHFSHNDVFYFAPLTLSHTNSGSATGCGRMINWKVLDRRRSWSDEYSISPFCCRY